MKFWLSVVGETAVSYQDNRISRRWLVVDCLNARRMNQRRIRVWYSSGRVRRKSRIITDGADDADFRRLFIDGFLCDSRKFHGAFFRHRCHVGSWR